MFHLLPYGPMILNCALLSGNSMNAPCGRPRMNPSMTTGKARMFPLRILRTTGLTIPNMIHLYGLLLGMGMKLPDFLSTATVWELAGYGHWESVARGARKDWVWLCSNIRSVNSTSAA